MDQRLIDKIAVTFELVGGTRLSEAAANVVIADLEKHNPVALSKALDRCRNECKGKLTPADIHSRVDDGRPSPNEAWGLIPQNEGTTVVWSEEMCKAMESSWPLIHDRVAARMAFLEAYKKLLDTARAERRPVKWSISLGENRESRLPILNRAIIEGKITEDEAMKALPAAACPTTGVKQLAGGPASQKMNHSDDVKAAMAESKKRLAELAGTLSKWDTKHPWRVKDND